MSPILIGSEIVGRIAALLAGSKWSVECPSLPPNVSAILNSRATKLYQPGDEDVFWVYDTKPHGILLLSDSDYGRLPISDRMRPRYIASIQSVLNLLSDTSRDSQNSPDHVSEVKGILNRCVRKDQWDWFTVYNALGHPPISTLRIAAQHLGDLARAIRDQRFVEANRLIIYLVNLQISSALEKGLKNITADVPRLNGANAFITNSSKTIVDASVNDRDEESSYVLSHIAKAKLERANKAHEFTLVILVNFLKSQGFIVEHNRLIDAYCRLKTGPAIFEVKSLDSGNERVQCRHALSQLYEYRYLHSIPEASLWLVLSQPPVSSWLVDYLRKDRNIEVLWVEGDMLGGPGKRQLLMSWQQSDV